MIRTIIKLNLNINYIVACNNTAEHCALNTLVNSRNVFLWNSTADNVVNELIALVLVRIDIDLNVTVLTLTTWLTSILFVNRSFLADSFLVCNLWSTDVCFYLKFTEKTVNNDFEVEFTHTCDDCLACFFVCISLESRIFFCKLCKSDTHLFLTCFCLRLNSNTNYRIREFHRLKDNRSLLITESITCCCIFKTNGSSDVTCIYAVDIFSVVSVHLQDTTKTLVGVLNWVVNSCAGRNCTGVNSEEAELTNKRVSSNLECESCEWLFIWWRSFNLIACFRVNTLDSRYICRSRHIINDSIKEHLNTLVTVRRTAGYRYHCVVNSSLSDCALDFVDCKLFAAEVFLHKILIEFSNWFDKFLMILVSEILHLFRNFLFTVVCAVFVVIDFGLHSN